MGRRTQAELEKDVALDTGVPYDSATAALYAQRSERTLTKPALDFRKAFVREYIKDFRAPNALARLGLMLAPKTMNQRGSQLLQEPYVRRLVDDLVAKLQPSDIVTRGQVIGGLWKEANDPSNSGSERISAYAHIGKMLGMGQASEQDGPEQGVLLVPVHSNWADDAASQQAKLKAEVNALPAAKPIIDLEEVKPSA